jgi:hypothetical protein
MDEFYAKKIFKSDEELELETEAGFSAGIFHFFQAIPIMG